ncbi:MAG: hypothetical protein R6V05_00430 [Candidatus Brocadiia bacterium]
MRTVRLAQPNALAGRRVRVDREAGRIRDVSILTRGPAVGHGFHVDDVMLRQVADGLNAMPRGALSRVSHPQPGQDPIFLTVGRAGAGGVRIRDGQVRGDVQLGPYARHTPAGDLWSWLLSLAEDDPTALGLSLAFRPAEYERSPDGRPLGRVRTVTAVDFTGDPAANPAGLLRTKGEGLMNEALRAYLVTIGLSAGASDEEAREFMDGLAGVQRRIADALAAEPEPQPVPAGVPASADGDNPAAPALRAERRRVKGLVQMVQMGVLPSEKLADLVESGVTPDQAKTLALGHLTHTRGPLPLADPDRAVPGVRVGRDRNRHTLGAALRDAILLRAGVSLLEFDERDEVVLDSDGKPQYRDPHPRAIQLQGASVVGLARVYLRSIGIPGAEGMAPARVIREAFDPRHARAVGLAQSTSDFPYILGDAMGKSLLTAYAEYPTLWPKWARRRTHPDFKDIKVIDMALLPTLTARPEGGEVRYVTIGESQETYTLAEFAEGVKLTRQAIINDDMDAFSRLPAMLAASARRLEDIVTLAVLTGNAAMSDGTALFHADHGNLAAGGDVGAPSVTTLNTARTAMRKQKSGDAYLALTPAVLLGPTALEGTIQELLESKLRATSNAAVDNPWQGKLEYGVHPLLDETVDADTDEATWYLTAEPRLGHGVEVCFLEDEQTPQVKSETEFDTDDVKTACRHTVAAKAVGSKGLYKNPGD